MRVILADDSILFREGVARVLVEAGFDVVAQVTDAESLLTGIAEHAPDVAIVDIRMPPTHTTEGLAAAQRIRDEFPGVGVLVLSQHLEPHYAMRLVDDGPRGAGYILKDGISDLGQFSESVRRVGAGETVIDSAIVSELLSQHRHQDPIQTLTTREREVLGLMAEGRSNQAIAERLFLTVKTVEAHVHAIFMKLGLEATADDHRRVLAVLQYLRS